MRDVDQPGPSFADFPVVVSEAVDPDEIAVVAPGVVAEWVRASSLEVDPWQAEVIRRFYEVRGTGRRIDLSRGRWWR